MFQGEGAGGGGGINDFSLIHTICYFFDFFGITLFCLHFGVSFAAAVDALFRIWCLSFPLEVDGNEFGSF